VKSPSARPHGDVTIGELSRHLPAGVQVSLIRKQHHNVVPSPDLVVSAGDALLIVAEEQASIDAVAKKFGRLEPGRIGKGPLGPELHPGFRRQGGCRRRAAVATAASDGFPAASAARPPLRYGYRSDPRS